jgi:uncharacterized membrane protein
LEPGLAGCDLLLPLFATPLNVVTLVIWMAAAQSWRERKLSAQAGGVRILKRGGEIRARLAAFTPIAAALGALGGASFFLAFPVVAIGGFAPSMTVMLMVWAVVLAAIPTAFFWTLKNNRSGNYDLRINEVSRVVTVPVIEGRRRPLTLERSEILGVSLQRRITKTPSGDYVSYLPAIDRAGGESGSPTIKLTTRGWTHDKAWAFGEWLGEELGVEFKGVEGDSTK